MAVDIFIVTGKDPTHLADSVHETPIRSLVSLPHFLINVVANLITQRWWVGVYETWSWNKMFSSYDFVIRKEWYFYAFLLNILYLDVAYLFV
jgi:hypothetical protein